MRNAKGNELQFCYKSILLDSGRMGYKLSTMYDRKGKLGTC